MTNLSDTQLVLLSTAAQRDSGNLFPLAATLTASRPAIDKSITSLIKRRLVEEGKVTDADLAWHSDGNLQLGIHITTEGRAAIGLTDHSVQPPADATPEAVPDKKQTKAALIVSLLGREQGATLDELASATGWLPHTTRAALTGLRKKGRVIVKGKRGQVTCYNFQAVA